MAENKICPLHDLACKKVEDSEKKLDTLEKDVRGEGVEGKGGLYGEIKKRVTYRTLSILLSLVVPVAGYFFYAIFELRGQTAATAATVKALCDNTNQVLENQRGITNRMDTFNTRQLRVMQKLELDPKWGE